MIQKSTFGEMVRFGVVGVVATVLHYLIYWVLQHSINVNVAYTIGYALSFMANYYLSARYTFHKERSVKNGIGFAMAHVFNYLLQLSLLNLFLWLGVSKPLAPIPVYCIAVPVNFLLVRFVFNKYGKEK